MNRERKHLSPEEKLAILRQYVVDKIPISDLCDKHSLQPSQIYNWQAQLFEHGAEAFARRNKANDARAEAAKDRRIAFLEEKLAKKNEVIAELLEENVLVKKQSGEL